MRSPGRGAVLCGLTYLGVQGGAVHLVAGPGLWLAQRACWIQDWGEIRGGVRGLVGVGPFPVMLRSCPGGEEPNGCKWL